MAGMELKCILRTNPKLGDKETCISLPFTLGARIAFRTFITDNFTFIIQVTGRTVTEIKVSRIIFDVTSFTATSTNSHICHELIAIIVFINDHDYGGVIIILGDGDHREPDN